MSWLLGLLGTTSAGAIIAVIALALAYKRVVKKLWETQLEATATAAELDVSLRLNKGLAATLKKRKDYVNLLEKSVVANAGPDKLAELLNELYGTSAGTKAPEGTGRS